MPSHKGPSALSVNRCVLDEVDAALDEANVQRFANLLAEFARQIQFIVVTHNRATMDKADAMYGVSMDAAGVSQVFSVRPGSVAASARKQPDGNGSSPVEQSNFVQSTL